MSSVEEQDRDEDSLSEQQKQVLKNSNIYKNKSGSRYTKHINSQQSLYKQALKQYMFGNFQIASQSCKKMITNNPQYPQPYFLMATMYQEAAKRNNDQNQLQKSVQYFFFHAYYSTPAIDKWIKVADMSNGLKAYMQAAYCYGRALKINKNNLQLSLKRAQCLEMCLQIKKAVNIYKRIIQKVSNSVQVYKRYAKLRFRRQQYTKARQILLSYPNFDSDINIKYMSAQTYLKQRKYHQLYNFILQNIIQFNNKSNINIFQQVQFQFIQMLFICRVNCKDIYQNYIKIQDLFQYLTSQYQQKYSALYEQIIMYIKKDSPQITVKLLKYLLQYDEYKTIQNYLYLTEYLIRQQQYLNARDILQNAMKNNKYQHSMELITQLNYLNTFIKQENLSNGQIYHKSINHHSNQLEEIFYSDQQSKQDQYSSQNIKIAIDNNQSYKKRQRYLSHEQRQKHQRKQKKIKKAKKHSPKNEILKHLQIKDPQILSKLIQNNYKTLNSIKNQITNSQNMEQISNNQQFYNKKYLQVKDCLKYLIQIQGNNTSKINTQLYKNSYIKHSIFPNKQQKKRRIGLDRNHRGLNLIAKNSVNLIESLKCIIWFIKQYIKKKKYLQIIDLTQLLSKAHFFKCQNRIQDFKLLKKQVYQIGLLACLQLQIYGKSIFFIRYLINRNPDNQFYLLVAQKIMRLSADKLFINLMIKRGIQWNNQTKNGHLKDKNLLKMYYLIGLQYMQNCFFQLSINTFLKVLSIIQQQQIKQSYNQQYKQIQKNIYLCICCCFLQIASSRTVFNKLQFVNRSIYCFLQYRNLNLEEEKLIVMYNQGRFYSYVRMYGKAILCYEMILNAGSESQITQRAALNLMVIYKDMENFVKIRELSQKYFSKP